MTVIELVRKNILPLENISLSKGLHLSKRLAILVAVKYKQLTDIPQY